MFWVAQLDPASLSMWLDTTLLNRTEDGATLASAAHFAAFGQLEELDALVSELPDNAAHRARAIASTIWHEQRHFLDLVLTNYGGLRFRQYSSLYVNQRRLLSELLNSSGPSLLPLDAYADPIRLIPFVSEIPEALAIQGRDIRSREDDLEFDRTRIRGKHFERIEVGGHGQMEALAYVFQIGAVETRFGFGASLGVQEVLRRIQGQLAEYLWPLELSRQLGLTTIDESDQTTIASVNVLPSILLATLSTRGLGQKIPDDDFKRPAYPATRLMAFLEYLDNRDSTFVGVSPAEAWVIVNEICSEIFGRSVIEEIREDQARWRSTLANYEASEVDDSILRPLRELTLLRDVLIEMLDRTPEMIVDPAAYADNMLDRVLPLVIHAFPDGAPNTESGWQQLVGYRHEAPGKEPVSWVWAVIPEEAHRGQGLTLSSNSWIGIAEHCAPLARLMIKGNSHSDVFPPQLVSWMLRLESGGARIRIEGGFKTPPNLIDTAGPLFDLVGADLLVCDTCRKPVTRSAASLISPWWFRQSDRTEMRMLELYSKEEDPMARCIRDWSVWLVCDSCTPIVLRVD